MPRPAGVDGQGVRPHPVLAGYDGVEQPRGVGAVVDSELTLLSPSHIGCEVEALEGEGEGVEAACSAQP